jgi:hypothetical protein
MKWKVVQRALPIVLACAAMVSTAQAQTTAPPEPAAAAPAPSDPAAAPIAEPAAATPAEGPVVSGAALAPTPVYSPAPPPPPAEEGTIKDTSEHRRPMALSAMAFVPWWYGIGIGASLAFEIPIVHNGFIPGINDSFSIEPSFSFAWTTWRGTRRYFDDDHGLLFRPAVAALWSFYFKPNLRAYAELNIGYARVNRSYESASRTYTYGYNYFYGELNVGMFYNVHKNIALRAEVGFYGMRAGAAFMF